MNKYFWPLWVFVIGMGILSVMYGCSNEREMDEHYMRCVILAEGEAFCR